MFRRWRKALGLSLALALVAAVIFAAILAARLDASRLAASALSSLPAWAARATHGGRAEFSLLQGPGLRLRDVRIQGRDGGWRLHADALRLSLSFRGLLRGRADIRGVELVHPTLTLSPRALPPAPPAGLLPAGWMRLAIRQGEIRAADRSILRSLDGTIRRVHDRREITWEARALTDSGSLTLQGRIRRRQDGRHDLFGSLKIKGARPASLPAAWRRGWPALLERDLLDASLTFDMDADARWSLFGDVRLGDAQGARNRRPDLRWRGKVMGHALRRLAWRDAYLNLGKAAFATHGSCQSPPHASLRSRPDCRFDLDARNADIRPLAALAGGRIRARGRMDMTAKGTLHGGVWQLAGKGALRAAAWNDVPLPDARLTLGEMQWRPGARASWALKDLRLTPEGARGALRLNASVSPPGAGSGGSGKSWRIEARLERLRDAWAAWGNALLKQFGRTDTLEGEGIVDGKAAIAHRAGRLEASCRLDATRARLAWKEMLTKPAGVPARLDARLERGKGAMQLRLRRLELGASRLADSAWRWQGERLVEASAADIVLEPDALRQAGVALPAALQGWHGRLRGSLTGVRPTARLETLADTLASLARASGRLTLDGFGKTQRFGGQVELAAGRLRARPLRWQGSAEGGDAMELDADVRLPAAPGEGPRGRADIRRARLRWGAGASLPGWLKRADLRGALRETHLAWAGNDWELARAGFRLHDGGLEFSRLRGTLAGGSVQSPKLTLIPAPDGVRFNGLVRLGAVRLGQVQGLSKALGAKLDGYLYLNARLSGALPWTAAAWGGDGDVEIQRGRWRALDDRIHLAAGEAALPMDAPLHFSRLTTRFRFAARASTRARLMLPRLRLELGAAGRQGVLSGRAAFYAGGALAGTALMRRGQRAQRVALSGVWPELEALLGSGEETHAPAAAATGNSGGNRGDERRVSRPSGSEGTR